MLHQLTFPLAIVGYAGLTSAAILAVRRPGAFERQVAPLLVWRIVAALILLHVVLVWHTRYAWQIGLATRNGYTGFILFHTALATILASTVVTGRLRYRLILAAFLVVTAGAIGATSRYSDVLPYRIPVLLFATLGVASILTALLRRRAESP